ncbi:MAG TPA: biopolymer transporter ExbD [Candidatus Acidoferrales bacterium]
MARTKVKAQDVMSAPNVIPMADIMLVLLIIFMVVTPMLQKGTPVDMARVENPQDLPDADKDDAVIVAVTRDGYLFLGNTRTELDVVSSQIRDLISGRMDKTVYIRSDGRAKYGDVVKLVDEVRSAGVDNVGLLTDKIETGRTTPPPPAD